MNEYQLPENISFNFEELKQELTAKVQMYKTLVYTDEQIVEAKKDKASLNKLKTALNDERIRLQKEYLEPFNKFKAQIDEIISIIDEPVKIIDKQIKEADEKKKADKLEEIKKYWNSTEIVVPIPLTFEQIFNSKWLNASVSMKSIKEEIDARLIQIESDLLTLQNLPEFSFEAVDVYKTTLNLNKAIQEGHRLSEIQKRKAEAEAQAKARAEEQERRKAEAEFAKHMNPPVETVPEEVQPVSKQWVSFKALVTTEEAFALRNFFNERNIEFKPI